MKETNNGKKGGMLKGKSHAAGGIAAVVTDTNQVVELESAEAIINKKSMKDQEIITVTGTPCEIASEINSKDGNGVKIPCDDVASMDTSGANEAMKEQGGAVHVEPKKHDVDPVKEALWHILQDTAFEIKLRDNENLYLVYLQKDASIDEVSQKIEGIETLNITSAVSIPSPFVLDGMDADESTISGYPVLRVYSTLGKYGVGGGLPSHLLDGGFFCNPYIRLYTGV